MADSGYTGMTPIQAKAIPIMLAGRDVMGAAQLVATDVAARGLDITNLPVVFDFDVRFHA